MLFHADDAECGMQTDVCKRRRALIKARSCTSSRGVERLTAARPPPPSPSPPPSPYASYRGLMPVFVARRTLIFVRGANDDCSSRTNERPGAGREGRGRHAAGDKCVARRFLELPALYAVHAGIRQNKTATPVVISRLLLYTFIHTSSHPIPLSSGYVIRTVRK